MRHFILPLVSALALLPAGLALAQTTALPSTPASPLEQPRVGMRHMTVVPNTPKAAIAPAPVIVQPDATIPEPEKKKPLTDAERFVKAEDLKPWSHLSQVLLLQTKDSVDQMVRIVEADPGSVPPQGLFFLAKGLADQGRMEDAGMYYYIGQLRLSFDTMRWPPRLDPADVKRLLADQKKTYDQRGQIPVPSTPKFKNPHEGVALLATTIGAPITQWMLEDPARGDVILARVKTWDEQAPYAYHPGYDLPEATAYADWPKMLTTTRDSFYKRINQFIAGLKKIKAQ